MKRFPAAVLFLSLASASFSPIAGAAPRTLEDDIRARRVTAQALAAKRRWAAAFQTLAAARERINTARQAASSPSKPAIPPALRQETRALSAWLAAKKKQQKSGEPLPNAVIQEFRRRQTVLRQKAAKLTPPRQPDPGAKRAALRYGLLLAEVDDTAAALHESKGDAAESADLRLEAGRRRLSLYTAAGKKTESAAWAARLSKSGAGDPATIADLAEYHQGEKRFGPAIQFWQQAIRLREKDSSTSAALETQVYYRQLAYCYDRVGKNADRDAARAAASRLEAAHAPKRR